MQSLMKSILNAALLSWILFGVFAWILRDGLGPDSVESSGWSALVRLYWGFYWGPVLIALAVATLALSRCMRNALADPPAAQLHNAADDASHRS
jgi:hypothetical protein